MAEPTTIVLVELGLDFHRQLFLFSREERLLVASTLLTAALHEYPKAVREEMLDASCTRAGGAIAVARAAQDEGDDA